MNSNVNASIVTQYYVGGWIIQCSIILQHFCSQFLVFVDHEKFADCLLPDMKKAMLRNPELVIHGNLNLTYLLTTFNIYFLVICNLNSTYTFFFCYVYIFLTFIHFSLQFTEIK